MLVIYLVPKSHLEYRTILLHPLACFPGMLTAKLKKIAKDRHTRDLRKILDLCCIGSVEIADSEEDDRNQGNAHV